MSQTVSFFSLKDNENYKKLEKLLSYKGIKLSNITNIDNLLSSLKKSKILILDIDNPDNFKIITNKIEKLNSDKSIIITSSFSESFFPSEVSKYEFFKKPINYSEFFTIITDKLKKNKNKDENEYRKISDNFVIKNSKMIEIYKKIKKIADTDATVLIYGETGTGKEVIADEIQKNSSRQNNPFVKINCAALPDNLLESELFGYEKGAFTGADSKKIGKFEYADRGTIFLDEIGEMPLKLQAKLLRVIQEQQVERLGSNKSINIDVRIITATNKNLKKLSFENKFREDLFYRLNVINITIPPLRERKEEIPTLANYFLKTFNKKYKKNIYKFTDNVMRLFKNYKWPGNIRELKNLIESIVILSENKIIGMKELPQSIIDTSDIPKLSNTNPSQSKTKNLEENEKELILKTLNKTNWNKSKAAKLLNISRKTLYNKLNKYNIDY